MATETAEEAARVAETVEEEGTVVEVLEFDVAYGQGHLVGSPRPVKDDVIEAEDEPDVSVAV